MGKFVTIDGRPVFVGGPSQGAGSTGSASSSSDWQSGLYDFEIQVENTLRESEAGIVNQDYETAIAFDEGGNLIFQKDGDESQVLCSRDEQLLLQDMILTHNHPAHLVSGSFSEGDIKSAMNFDVQEIRAVGWLEGKPYVHSLVRPDDGWPPVGQGMYELITGRGQVFSQFEPLIKSGAMTMDDFNRDVFHLSTQYFADQVGATYTRSEL